MTPTPTEENNLTALLAFIPLFEEGAFKDASSLYVSTGEYPPHARELLEKLRSLHIAQENFDWLAWTDSARPYLQEPLKISTASFDDIAKLAAIAVDAQKFNKSLFPHLCSSGFLHQLLIRIRTLCS